MNTESVPSEEALQAWNEKRFVIGAWKAAGAVAALLIGLITATVTVTAKIAESSQAIQASNEAVLRLQGEMKGRFDVVDNRLANVVTINELDAYFRILGALNPQIKLPDRIR